MALLGAALRLHRLAQALRRETSLADVCRSLLETTGLPTAVEPAAALWAAGWAARLGRRLGGWLDTCLLRSLVAGTLLADRPGVVLRVGVRRSASAAARLRAHAWLTVDGETLAAAPTDPPESFHELLVIPLERGA